MKSQRETLRNYLLKLDYDIDRLERLKLDAEPRGLDPDEIQEWIDRFRDWRGAVSTFERGWVDPRADKMFRRSAVGRALERQREVDQGRENPQKGLEP